MIKGLLLTIFCVMLSLIGFSQTGGGWAMHNGSKSVIVTDKAVSRLSFPKNFELFDLNLNALKQGLFSVTGAQARQRSVVITLPNADGALEQFEVFEASNFEPALQAKFPEIRAFSGKGITDRSATVKLSYSPQGIQTMVFRTEKENEFIEPYSKDHAVYAVFRSERNIGKLPWTCSTQDQEIFSDLSTGIGQTNRVTSNAGELKTMRLAQSCNGEYSNYFGAFNASQVNLVLAAFNATLTRCNGVYEKDLALHLNLIPNTADVIFYDPLTDPYTTLGAWNGQLQTTLTNIIGDANYDIGHMFGASGGGGNAGCIGCVCGPGKGSGITSPADGIPQGDNFDIDYVAHEVGHQLGGNHTFSMGLEAGGANNVEVGSGITVMGYAGITNQDVAPHSIDIFHERSIQQIQNNLATKTCPITTNISATNATPVVAPVANYTIPISTPFALTGVATDANPGDVLTYCWEQNDNANSSVTGNNSVAFATKLVGPNWLTWPATTSPVRYFPRLQSILAGALTTGPLPGGDAIATTEALSSVSRTLNFRLTVRDNSPYVSTPPVKVGQTAFRDMTVTVSNTSGPFAVTIPNTNVSWEATTSQTVQWSVNNTTAAPVSCANVRILLSTDGGLTFPFVLSASTANDGSELVVIPNTPSTTARIKVESIGNIFFDISNTNFTIPPPTAGFSFNATTPATITCAGPTSAAITLGTTVNGTFVTPIILTASGAPTGTTVSFSPATIAPGASTTVTLNNTQVLSAGSYNITVTGTAGTLVQNAILTYTVSPGTAPTITTNPADQTVCVGANGTFTVAASGPAITGYQWQVSTNGGASYTNIVGATASSYTVTGATIVQNTNLYRVLVSSQCGTTTSTGGQLFVQTAPFITAQPQNVTACAGVPVSFSVTATGSGLTYQWQVSTDGGTVYNNIPSASGSTYSIASVTLAENNNRYRVIVSGNCPSPVTSAVALLQVGNAASISGQPASTTVCVGANANFSVTATGSSLTYQWQVSTNGGTSFTNITGATGTSLTLTSVTAGMTANQYRVNVFSCTPTPITSSAATLTVNTLAAINTQPADVTLCAGGDATFTSAAVGTGIAYQWQLSATGCAGTFTNITGANAATLTISNTTAAQNGTAYRVVVTGTCNTVTSACALLTVNSPIVITTQPANTSACLPTQTSASFSVVVTGTAPTFQWQVSTNGGTSFTNITGATAATLNVTGLTASMTGYQYRAVLNGTCTSGLNSSAATLTVNTLVEITGQPTNKSVCAGSNTSFAVTATGSTITYQWQVSVNGGPFVNVINGAPYAGATTTTLSITSAPTILNSNRYRVIVSGVPCGSVTSNVVTLTVNNLPSAVLVAAQSSSLTPYINSSLFTTVSPSGTYTYQWFRDGFIVPGATGASLPVNVDGFGTYSTVVTDVNGCSATTNNVTISAKTSDMVFVYPNPSRGQFQVRYFSASRNEAFVVNVYDGKGTRVFSKQFPINATYSRMDVDLRNANDGVYMLEVRNAQGKRLASSSVIISR